MSADVSKAFLQGVTYKELAELTGEPIRDVSFSLPHSSVPTLQKLQDFHDFDPNHEVLGCTKPGTGLVDAPRAFSIKLARVTRDICGMQQRSGDPELEVLHQGGALISMAHRSECLNTTRYGLLSFVLAWACSVL